MELVFNRIHLQLAEINRYTQLVEICNWDEEIANSLIVDIEEFCQDFDGNSSNLIYDLQMELKRIGWDEEVYIVVADIFEDIIKEYNNIVLGE